MKRGDTPTEHLCDQHVYDTATGSSRHGFDDRLVCGSTEICALRTELAAANRALSTIVE